MRTLREPSRADDFQAPPTSSWGKPAAPLIVMWDLPHRSPRLDPMTTPTTRRYEPWMHLALAEAADAAARGDVPVGAVILDATGTVIAQGHNTREAEGDPTGHAEIVAIRAAAKALQTHATALDPTAPKDWRLIGCTLVVTLEP